MFLAEYDIDLKLLEEMCSELEEGAFLVDRHFRILWANKSLKEFLKGIGIHHLADEYIKIGLYTLYGTNILTEQIVRKVFSTGKLSKSSLHVDGRIIKKTSIPIKYGNDVVFVLEVIDDIQSHIPESYANILRHFLNKFRHATVLASTDRAIIVNNDAFDREFSSSLVLKDMVLNAIKKPPKGSLERYLNSMLALTHKVELKDIDEKKSGAIGQIMSFKVSKGKRRPR